MVDSIKERLLELGTRGVDYELGGNRHPPNPSLDPNRSPKTNPSAHPNPYPDPSHNLLRKPGFGWFQGWSDTTNVPNWVEDECDRHSNLGPTDLRIG